MPHHKYEFWQIQPAVFQIKAERAWHTATSGQKERPFKTSSLLWHHIHVQKYKYKKRPKANTTQQMMLEDALLLLILALHLDSVPVPTLAVFASCPVPSWVTYLWWLPTVLECLLRLQACGSLSELAGINLIYEIIILLTLMFWWFVSFTTLI